MPYLKIGERVRGDDSEYPKICNLQFRILPTSDS